MSNAFTQDSRFEKPGIGTWKSTWTFFSILLLIGGIYGAWLMVFWPGILGEDSLSVIFEIEREGAYQSGKPVFWYYFVKLMSGPRELVEIPIAVQMLISAALFSRILSWCLLQGMTKIFFFGLIFICLAPNVIYFVGTLYADGIFSVCITGLLFEFWLIAKRRKITYPSLAVLTVALPFAAFARPNGLVFLAALLPLIVILQTRDRLKLVTVALLWCSLNWIGMKEHRTASHGALFPLALFETVNFLQPRPMNLWRETPRVSDSTVQILTQHDPLPKILESYDPDYWDPLVYKEGGANFLFLNRNQRKQIVIEFFTYNLWNNIPDFLGSRVNIFMVAALAQGGFPALEYSSIVLKYTRSQSEFRKMNMERIEPLLRTLHEFSYGLRWLLWTPMFGIGLMFWVTRSGWQRRDIPALLVTVPMVIQLGGIFFFSIAGEYRYLLPYTVLPLVLLPIVAAQRQPAAGAPT